MATFKLPLDMSLQTIRQIALLNNAAIRIDIDAGYVELTPRPMHLVAPVSSHDARVVPINPAH